METRTLLNVCNWCNTHAQQQGYTTAHIKAAGKIQARVLPQVVHGAVSTAGGGLDGDGELQVWCSGMTTLEIEFAKENVDLFALNSFLNKKVLPSKNAAGESAAPFSRAPKTDPGALPSFLNWLGDDAMLMRCTHWSWSSVSERLCPSSSMTRELRSPTR